MTTKRIIERFTPEVRTPGTRDVNLTSGKRARLVHERGAGGIKNLFSTFGGLIGGSRYEVQDSKGICPHCKHRLPNHSKKCKNNPNKKS